MIRGGDPRGVVPLDKPDDGGLGGAMRRADDRGAAEADVELRIRKTTRAIFIDALYRAKALNGDAAFDIDDVEDLDAVEGMAERLAARRRNRQEARS
ncbi:hypothetical protein IED13_09685 [Bosea sp. SSUT16]|uniref:Uncharacterized protein n=1 Tax=Bosea spartocytisi TaxID=2773451 RepID=A0A927I111_9HYPH|nr:hypothetical protein [Bosea spartocytisi]MBD3845968.1 hypothetical protein [Bosea spartocytisi]MCT4473152.1 hypothetical protein [Bosea spartocytisi]